jgi:hypothetical protein
MGTDASSRPVGTVGQASKSTNPHSTPTPPVLFKKGMLYIHGNSPTCTL